MGDFSVILREAGFRATSGRIRLLELLARERKPLTIIEVKQKLKEVPTRKAVGIPTKASGLNEVTLYRALEAMAAKGIVERTELGHGHAHFELAAKHHHHVVCTDCGAVEDIADPKLEAAVERASRKSRSFKKITNHSVELFGLCAQCA